MALEIAHPASFLMSNSACWRRWTRGRIIFASITACTYQINVTIVLNRHFKLLSEVYAETREELCFSDISSKLLTEQIMIRQFRRLQKTLKCKQTKPYLPFIYTWPVFYHKAESITKAKFGTCIWALFPAVIFEIVQQASFLMLFLWFWVRSW